MAKIRNPKLFSEQFDIDSKILNKMGIFNPILNLDTKLFIDPILLNKSRHQIIKIDGVAAYNKYFEGIVALLSKSKSEEDFAWKSAYRLLPKKEIPGTCLGYGVNSISGRGISEKNKSEIIKTANEIIKLGIQDPELFHLLPLLNEGIGPDSISDLTTSAIVIPLCKFTEEKAIELKIPTISHAINGEDVQVIRNPLRPKSFILLLPKDILRNLPLVEKWEDIEFAARFNNELRSRVNRLLAGIFKARTKADKKAQIANLMTSTDAVNVILDVIKGCKADAYNFDKDNGGLVIWEKAKESLATTSFALEKSITKTKTGLSELVGIIIEKYKFLIEEKGLNKLIWKDSGDKHLNEKVAQMLFFAVAHSYCVANNIDISPEMDTGTGMLDFKFSVGYKNKVIVEIKYSDNPNILHGYDKQLKQYLTSEETDLGYYVIVDVGKLGDRPQRLDKMKNDVSADKSKIVIVNAKKKPSASRLR